MKQQETQETTLFKFAGVYQEKVMPQWLDLEQNLLGMIINKPDYLVIASTIIQADDFYKKSHQHVFQSLKDLYERGTRPDLFSLMQDLKEKREFEFVGGFYGLTKILNSVSGFGDHAEGMNGQCRILKQYSIARKLIKISAKVMEHAYAAIDPLELLDSSALEMEALQQEVTATKVEEYQKTVMETFMDVQNTVIQAKAGIKNPNHVYTGFSEWDRINGPLFQKGVYVIAARPGMGKSALALQICRNIAATKEVGLVISEMTKRQVIRRLAVNIQGINNRFFKDDPKYITENELSNFYSGIETVADLKLHIEEAFDIAKVCNLIRFWKKKFDIKVAVIDYLQVISAPEELLKYFTDVQEINYNLVRIERLAKELDIPIILLSQLNRENLKRGGAKEPNIGDMKGSGKIEEIAFQIGFIHRPEYYGISDDESGESTAGLMYLDIQKHRDGETATGTHKIKLKFDGPTGNITDWRSEWNIGFDAFTGDTPPPF